MTAILPDGREATPESVRDALAKPGAHVRQGDVLLVRRQASGATLPREDGAVVLAYGEVTGHKHQLLAETTTKLRTTSGDEYVRAVEADVLLHEEHSAIPLIGDFELAQQVEYSPAALQNVAD